MKEASSLQVLGGSYWGWCSWGRRDFPILVSFFLRFSSLFFVLLLFSQDKSKGLQFTGKMGIFTPTPSAPTPFRTSRK